MTFGTDIVIFSVVLVKWIQDTYSMLVISFSVINYVVSMRVCT